MSRPRVTLGALASILLVAACSRSPATPPAEIPNPDLTQMEPPVASLLSSTREELLARPDSAEAWGALGAAYDAHGLGELAERCYRRAHELAPSDFRWLYLLAIAREINGAETDELRTLFARVLELDPGYVAAHIRLGDGLARRGLPAEARAQFQLAIDQAPKAAVAHRGLGQVLLREGDAAEALEALERAAELEPGDRVTWAALAEALERLGREDEAERARKRAQTLDPSNVIEDPVYHELVSEKSVASSRVFRRGITRYRQADYEGALRDFEQVATIRADDPSVLFWLGSSLGHLGRSTEAIPHLSRAIELDPALVRARSALGEAYFAQNRFDEAEAQYEAALATAPSAEAWLALAEVRMRQEDLEGVVEAYSRAAEVHALEAREEMNWGVALMRTDRPGQALEHFRRSIELNPKSAHAHYNLGIAHRLLGDEEAATREFTKAVAIDPGHRAAQELRAP